MRTKSWIVCVLVFVFGLTLFAGSKISKKGFVARSFTTTSLIHKVDAAGAREFTGVNVRVAKATGEWLETRYRFDGHTSVWAVTADSVYSMSKGASSREFRSRYDLEVDRTFRSASFLKSHPEFNRMEQVAGLTTYVHRAANDDVFLERSFAPECGLSPLKTVFRNSDGETLVEEVVSLEFRDVSDEEVALPEIPVTFDYIERKIEGLRANGLTEGAARLEGLVREMTSKQKIQ